MAGVVEEIVQILFVGCKLVDGKLCYWQALVGGYKSNGLVLQSLLFQKPLCTHGHEE